MLETIVQENPDRKNMFRNKVTYMEPTREGSTAIKKEAITAKYPESLQLNLLRKAILGDAVSIAKLQEMENYINEV